MGDIKRKRKKFSRPKKPFDKTRIDEENVLVTTYGLKNKREIWKAISEVSKLRRRAKVLIGAEDEKKKAFFEKLSKLGIVVKDIADVLALTEKDIFERRLQTILFRKGIVNTPKQARQLIVHKHVLVDGNIVNSPSFTVTKKLENKIVLKRKRVKAPVKKLVVEEESLVEEVKEEKESKE